MFQSLVLPRTDFLSSFNLSLPLSLESGIVWSEIDNLFMNQNNPNNYYTPPLSSLTFSSLSFLVRFLSVLVILC
uniref:Uncharacterized protein n=1 Tax=Noccaea caerulescens TaxID=107243 RepID=A0A1J3IZ57_NOCCA